MMKKSPVQLVREQFGSKAELASKLVPILFRPEGETEGEFLARLTTASNKQLLRLWAAEERVKSEFGSRAKLVDEIVGYKFPHKGNATYKTKLESLTSTRLLSLRDGFAKGARA
jgi:hypothetical protein